MSKRFLTHSFSATTFIAVMALCVPTVSLATETGGLLVSSFASQQDLDGWQRYTDVWAKGNSLLTVVLQTQPTEKSLKVTPVYGDKFAYPFVGMKKFFVKGGEPVDMSAYKGLKIRVKGEAGFKVQMMTAEVTDFNEFSMDVTGEKGWKTIDCPFAEFRQSPFFGRKVQWNPAHLRGVQLHFEGVPGSKPGDIEIGEITLYK